MVCAHARACVCSAVRVCVCGVCGSLIKQGLGALSVYRRLCSGINTDWNREIIVLNKMGEVSPSHTHTHTHSLSLSLFLSFLHTHTHVFCHMIFLRLGCAHLRRCLTSLSPFLLSRDWLTAVTIPAETFAFPSDRPFIWLHVTNKLDWLKAV